MAYTEQTWTDGAAGGTPIDAARLTHIEDGIYNAAATADAAIPSSQKGAANGVASLDSTGKVPSAQLPAGSGGSSVLDWVSVKDHGAVGDGTTDDTTAIQAALNATAQGGVCYFPRANYKITAALTVPHMMRLMGGGSFVGAYTKITQATANTNGIVGPTTGSEHWTISGLSVVGPSGSTAGAGIISTQSVNVLDCDTSGFLDGLRITANTSGDNAFYCTVERSWFDSSARDGIRLEGIVNNVTISGGRATSNGATGIHATGGPLSVRVIGGDYESNPVNIDIDGHDTSPSQDTNAVLISGVYFEGSTGSTDIRIGNSATVYGVRIESCAFIVGSGGTQAWHVNAPAVNGLTIDDTTFWGTNSVTVGSSSPGVVWGSNYNKGNGTITLPATAIRLDSANVTPSADGTAAVGSSPYLARADHVHPASLTVQDENSNVATGVTQIDFQGAGVTATAGTGEVVVTIPGGGSSTGELLVQNGASNPPVTLTNEAADDWLFAG